MRYQYFFSYSQERCKYTSIRGREGREPDAIDDLLNNNLCAKHSSCDSLLTHVDIVWDNLIGRFLPYRNFVVSKEPTVTKISQNFGLDRER